MSEGHDKVLMYVTLKHIPETQNLSTVYLLTEFGNHYYLVRFRQI